MGRGTKNLYTCWIPFGDIPVEMGTLCMLKGSSNLKEFEKMRETYGEIDMQKINLDGTGWFTKDPAEAANFGG